MSDNPLQVLSGAAAVILGFIALIGVAFSYHIVPPGHRGILVTLGKVNPDALPEGISFVIPFIQSIRDIPVQQLKADGKAVSFSSDLQNIDINYSIMYRVPDKSVVALFQQYKGDPYQSLIEPRAQEVTKQVSAVYRAEEMVKNREKVKEEILSRLRSAVGEILQIIDVQITNIDLSSQLEQAIEQKVVREQEALAKTFELDKEKRQAEITLVRAEAEAKAVKIKGEAIKASPEIINFEITQRWDGKAPLSVAVGQSNANVLLPLK